MDNQLINFMTFALVAALLVLMLIAILRFWEANLNQSQEDIALERRIASLNEDQAFRRRDDEIVRLLRGDEQQILGADDDLGSSRPGRR